MKKFLLLLLFFCKAPFAFAVPSVALDNILLGDFIRLYYSEIEKRPYVICDEVLKDTRSLSIRASGKQLDKAMFFGVMQQNGYSVSEQSGVQLVCKKANDRIDHFVYRPKYRSVSYLSGHVNKVLSASSFTSSGDLMKKDTLSAPASPLGSSGSSMSASTHEDVYIFAGPSSQLSLVKSLISALDVPGHDVVLKATIYEFADSANKSAAIRVAADLLGGAFSFDFGANLQTGLIRAKKGGLDVIGSVLDRDSRFSIVSRPYVKVSSGESADFKVGQKVPILGSITQTDSGKTTQSIEYRDSGVLLSFVPVVRGEVISLSLNQEISDFVRTEFGVDTSPTLNQRSTKTSLVLRSGDVVVVGGLDASKSDISGDRFLGFKVGDSRGSSRSQFLLLLEATAVDQSI